MHRKGATVGHENFLFCHPGPEWFLEPRWSGLGPRPPKTGRSLELKGLPPVRPRYGRATVTSVNQRGPKGKGGVSGG